MRWAAWRVVPVSFVSSRHARAAALTLAFAPAASAQPRVAQPVELRLATIEVDGPVHARGVSAVLEAERAALRSCSFRGVREGAEATIRMEVGDHGRVRVARVVSGTGFPAATTACLLARHRTLTFPTARGVGPTTMRARWVYLSGGAFPRPPLGQPRADRETPTRPTLTGVVTITALTSDAAASVSDLRESVVRRENELRTCYEARLDQRPRFQGTLVVTLNFEPGEPLHRPASVARTGGSLADAEVTTCVTTLLRRAVFRVEPETTRATISLAFTIYRLPPE